MRLIDGDVLWEKLDDEPWYDNADKIDSPKRESVMEKLAQAAEKTAPASPSPKRKEPER